MDKALWQQLQPLMDEALSLTAEARAPWLARIRVEAPTLAGELERLLEQQGTLDRRGFLETPAPGAGLVDQVLAGNATIMQRDRLGEALASRYTLGEPLGQGGMASVYRATDLKHRREVAIKVIRPDATTTLGAERFLAEIRLTANLTHPNILPLLDSGEAAGVLYYVMPLVEGESLRAKLRREGALPLDEATRLLRVVAEALAHAHRKGLVHRDIKPDNVLLSGREAWVADFGIAKAMAATATAAHAATSVGVALGSPGYMAPEQIEASGAVDHRADLYSWGVMAWEVLAGRPPFAGSSMQQLFVQHLTATPESITTARPEVPPALAEAVMRCLAKNASDRFATADELLAHLDLAQASGSHMPVAATSRRAWVIGTGVVAAAAVAGALLLRDRDEPWGAARVLAVPGDIAVTAFLSPDGSRLVYRRTTTAGVWVQHVDSSDGRLLTKAPATTASFLDDTTVVLFRRARSGPVPERFVHTGTGTDIPLPFAVDSTGFWGYLDPGTITHFAVSQDRRTLTLRRMSRTGMSEPLQVPLDSGERPLTVAGSVEAPVYVLATMMADSTLRWSRIEPGRARREVATVGASDSLHRYLRIQVRLSLDGKSAYAPIDAERTVHLDVTGKTPGYTIREHPVGGPFGGRSRSGHVVITSRPRTTETWRFPVPADPAGNATLVDRVQGTATEGVLSPDRQVMARIDHPVGPSSSLHVQSVPAGPIRVLIRSAGDLTGMRWSPDGTLIAVRETVRGMGSRWLVADVRSGAITRLGVMRSTWPTGVVPSAYPAVWSPDAQVLFATSLDSMAPEIRRFTLTEGDTGVVVHRGRLVPSLLDGLAMRPDGRAIAVGGEELVVVPLDGGPARTILARDTVVHRAPFLFRQDGTIAFAALDSRTVAVGGRLGLREISVVPERGGTPQLVGTFPISCRFHVGLLRGDTEATCSEMLMPPRFALMHMGRH